MRISDWSSDVCAADQLLERRKERFGIGMFEPIDAQLGAARRLGVEIVRHRDEARDERLIAPESDRIAAVDRDDSDRRTHPLPRRREEGLERGGAYAPARIFPRATPAGRA